MNNAVLLTAGIVLAGFSSLIAEDKRSPVYPFDVKVGGHLAAIEEVDPELAKFAKVKEPVAADAYIEVTGEGDSIIINIFPIEANESVPSDVATRTKIIFVKDAGKIVKLSQTLDGSVLEPGLYGMNIVYGGNTSRVTFEVKASQPAAPSAP
jgi:hypothetical protein